MDADFITHWLNILINPQIIYDSINIYAMMIFTKITPVLLVVAIAIRTTEESLDVASGNARWVSAVRDMIIYGLGISLYFGLFSLIAEFFNAIYGAFSQSGSLQTISSQLNSVLTDLGQQDSDTSVFSVVTGSISYAIGSAFHYFSLLLVTLIVSLLHLAQALGFGVAFCWGLIAIPMAITRNLTLLRGWALFTGFILIWPIIESFLIGMTTLLFASGSQGLTSGASGNVGFEAAGVLFIFTVLNIIVSIIAWVSPYLANSLVANAPAGKNFVVPFVAGAVGLATAATMIAKGSPKGSLRAFQQTSQRTTNAVDKIKERLSPVPPESKEDQPAKDEGKSSSDREPRTTDAQDQAKRGAIINNQKNKQQG